MGGFSASSSSRSGATEFGSGNPRPGLTGSTGPLITSPGLGTLPPSTLTGGPVSEFGGPQGGPASIYGTIAKPIRKAMNNPNTYKACAAGAIIGGGLFVWESAEAAQQRLRAPDPRASVILPVIGCLFIAGALALIPT